MEVTDSILVILPEISLQSKLENKYKTKTNPYNLKTIMCSDSNLYNVDKVNDKLIEINPKKLTLEH